MPPTECITPGALLRRSVAGFVVQALWWRKAGVHTGCVSAASGAAKGSGESGGYGEV